jgi:fido (protein-threonine AMPylation protein)
MPRRDRRGTDGQFDAAHLKALHRFLFQDVFELAGRTRNERVRLSDGEPVLRKTCGTLFPQKNDAADAEAICKAARRPSMRFVPVKD